MFSKRAIQVYLTAIALFVIAGAAFFFYKPTLPQVGEPAHHAEETQPEAPVSTTTIGHVPDSLVVVYAATATSTDVGGRNWPTQNIWYRVGNESTELAGTVGRVGEYPSGFMLSPTHDSVAVNLEKAVDVIDLATRQKKRVFTTDKWVIGAAYSGDGGSLVVSDGATYAGDDIPKPLYHIDLKTGASTVLVPDMRALGQGEIAPQILRKDNILLFYPVYYKDCGAGWLYSLDLTTHTATSTYERFGISDDGMLAIGSALKTVPTPPAQMGMCSDSVLPSIVRVVEPVSGHTAGSVGKAGEPFTLVAFSPDHTQVLFKTSMDLKKYTYYLQKIESGSVPAVVSDPNSILASWKASTGPVTYAQGDQNYNALYAGETPIAVSVQWPTLIGQFFK